MGEVLAVAPINRDTYLAWEAEQAGKHEYIAGEIFVMVSCDERDRSADLAIEHPCLVIEVLSESTSAYDRGTKFAAYRKLASLNEYLLIDIDARRLELYRREAGHWQFFEATLGEPPLPLQSVGLDLSAEQVFEDLAE